MSDRDLAQAADAHFRKTTVAYPEWQRRVAAGKYTPKDGSGTEWGKGFAALGKIGVVTPPPPDPDPPPTGQFGADLRTPPAEIPGGYFDVRTRAELLAAVASRPKVRLTASIDGELELSRRSDAMWELAFAPGVELRGRLLLSGTRGFRGTDIVTVGGWDGIKMEGGCERTHLVRPFVKDAVNIGISQQLGATDLWIDSPYTLRCGLTGTEPANQRHGIYIQDCVRWQITNHLAVDCQAFALQAYPDSSAGIYSGFTNRGGRARGGPVVEASGRVDVVGGVVTDSPAEAVTVYSNDVHVFDVLANRGELYGPSGTFVHCQTNANIGANAASWVLPARWGLLPATFRDGTPRATAAAGSEKV